jgi:hypothetical protein
MVMLDLFVEWGHLSHIEVHAPGGKCSYPMLIVLSVIRRGSNLATKRSAHQSSITRPAASCFAPSIASQSSATAHGTFHTQRLRPPREHKSAEGLITICSVHRRIERLWAERIKSLRQIRGQLDVATDRVQSAFNNKVR